jgi:phosphoglucosamine mutase
MMMMTRKLFGTDGIRGAANEEPMTAETALKIGMATALTFQRGRHRHRVLVGKDTRLSGYLLENALTAGFISMGMDVFLVGPMPTPAIGILTRSMRCDLGVMLSASHNPYQDNGIKLFGPDGYKLSDEVEREIEGRMADGLSAHLVPAAKLGRAKRLDDVHGRYIEFVKHTLPRGCTLKGLRIVLDCANGAAYRVAPEILFELGAEVIPLNVSPDGTNINLNCGSTAPQGMCEAISRYRADFGIALDGDADRTVLADENGALIDGDQVLGLIARHWQGAGLLKNGGVVATVMSNLGLERYLGGCGVVLIRTKVGDRYVVEQMCKGGYNVGGEQSGHIILSDYTTTGDGLIAALQVLAVVVGSGKPASQICRQFEPLPQLLKNVRYQGGEPLESEHVKAAIEQGRRRLGNQGRLVIRPSGTEPVVRVMAEGEDETLVGAVVDDICGAIRAVAA